MYDARQIANWFIEKEKEISLSKIFKLTYIAHEKYIVQTGKPLFFNKMEAWKNGPVIQDVYNNFHAQGVYVTQKDERYEDITSPAVKSLLEDVYNEYGNLSLPRLKDITNARGTPWNIMYYKYGKYSPLTYDIIKNIKEIQANHKLKASLKPA